MRKLCEGERVLLLERDGWEYVERKKGKEAVVVIAQTDDGRVILTEQMRRPVDAAVIDFPAGLIGDEEGGSHDPKVVARKELEEETGYTCDRLELLARGPTSPGITSEIATFFRARGVRQVGVGGGVGGREDSGARDPAGGDAAVAEQPAEAGEADRPEDLVRAVLSGAKYLT